MSGGGRRALVTGGSRGIGRAIALALAADGHRVLATARSEDGLAATVAAGNGRVSALSADLADPGACVDLAARATEALGGAPEIVVYAAGITRTATVADLDPAAWAEAMQVNVTGALLTVQPIIPAMLAAGWGRILTVASLYARFGPAQTAAYTASKHALLGLTRVLSSELVGGGITANAIVPGWTDTEMVRAEARALAAERGVEVEDILRRFLRIQPLGRMIEPEEVGAFAAFLCRDEAAAISGQALGIDGGSYQA